MFKKNSTEDKLCYQCKHPPFLKHYDVSTTLPEAMAMGKLHKDIGLVIVQSAEDADRTDGQVIKVS